MKFYQFKQKSLKKNIIWFSIIITIMLLTLLIIYRSFAIYEEKTNLNMIKGIVPNQEYDLKLSYTLTNESKQTSIISTIPDDKNYKVTITCDNDAVGDWNYEGWGPDIRNISKTRTKCTINFSKYKPLIQFGIQDSLAVNGNGIYIIGHNNAMISFKNEEENKNLHLEEYRYAGSNPNNYVTFNNELWRIIGLVNTLNGQRLKIVRNDSIGKYSWDSSEKSINNGDGINEWSESDLMNLLNNGPYYNRTNGTCCIATEEYKSSCDFSTTGLTNEAKEMIDTITWNTSSQGNLPIDKLMPNNLYNVERSDNIGKINCNNSSNYCNDNIIRKTTWTGLVALLYPSDYGYATASENPATRETCLNTYIGSWRYTECFSNNWIYDSSHNKWLLTPYSDYVPNTATYAFAININGNIGLSHASNGTPSMRPNSVFPALYLKSNVKIINGNGTIDTPYELSL